jgi:hypothetical protein
MKNLFVSLTMPRGKKHNQKTGPIPVSTTTAITCPSTCPFNNKNGCYANAGPLAIHWKKVTEGERGTNWEEFCLKIKALPEGQLWRWSQAGDFPHTDGRISRRLVNTLVKANVGKKGFGFSHHLPEKGDNTRIFKHANKHGFTINLSANNIDHADKLKQLNIAPVAVVLPDTVNGNDTPSIITPKGNKIVVCPATYRDNVTCSTCALCQKSKRTCIVGFPAHGTSKKKVNVIASMEK